MSLHTIPIAQRPSHGPLFSKLLFPVVFTLAQVGIWTAQVLALPLRLVPFVGRRWFESVIGYTKDGYGRLLILITVLFAPTSLVFTTDAPPELDRLIRRDAKGIMTRLDLPDRLVVMANHQAYLDWMYLWIMACYSGNARGIIILLKASLRKVPLIGWGMQNFKFIFMHRSWAADRDNLTQALTNLGKAAQAKSSESTPLLSRSPLWLLIFPEGTITSDEERVKSVRYAEREGVDDLVTMLHPRSTGLLFSLRALLAQVPDLQLLDVTIGYPGVPYGKYPQDYYGLASVFFRSVPPPTVHVHLHLYSDLSSGSIPSLTPKPMEDVPSDEVPSDVGLASKEEAREFELWLRSVWQAKEKRMEGFYKNQRFEGESEVVPIRQLSWRDTLAAYGAGGMATLAVLLGAT